jgi:uncharacterized membrane protein YhaH (DUF805 family)
MGWGAYLFGFKGCIGRGPMWLIYFGATLVDLIPIPNGLIFRELDFRSFGALGGTVDIVYPQFVSPVTYTDWALITGYFVLMFAALWIVVAAAVKRLHDRGRTGKWLALVFGGMVLETEIQLVMRGMGRDFIPLDVVDLILFATICIVGTLGMFEIFLLSGRYSRYDPAPDGSSETVNPA